MIRILWLVVLCLLPALARSQLITPAQQAQLDARYRKQDTNIPPSAITGTALTYQTVFSGVVTGSASSLQFAPNGVRFNVASNTIQRLDSNGVWQAVISGGSLRKVVAGGNSNNNVEELSFSSAQTNVTFGHVVAGSNSTITLQITGAVGPAGQDGIGNLYGARSWSSGLTYQTNTLVTYGNSVYISVAGITNSIVVPPSDPATWELWLTGGTNGMNGADGTDGIGYTPRGDWSMSAAYVTNDLVRAHEALYGAILNSTNIEPTVHASWTSYWRAVLYDGVDGAVMTATNILVYSGSAAYPSNVFVVYASQTYATLNPTVPGEVPGVSTNFVLAAARGGDGAAGVDGADGANGIGNMYWMASWNAGTSYPSNALVTHNRIVYYSKAANTGLDPAFNPSAWGVAAQALDGNGVIGGAWSNTITYTNQELVTRNNNLYFSLTGGNVGNDPTNSPLWWSLLLAGANTNSTLVLTNAVSTGAWLTVVYTNYQIIVGSTGTPLFVESDPIWVSASNLYYLKTQADAKYATGTPVYVEADTFQSVTIRGAGVTNATYHTNAPVVLAGSTNSAYIQFADGTVLKTASFGTAVVTNETDPIATAALTNYVSWGSNNTYSGGTTQILQSAKVEYLRIGDTNRTRLYIPVSDGSTNQYGWSLQTTNNTPNNSGYQFSSWYPVMTNGTLGLLQARVGPSNRQYFAIGGGGDVSSPIASPGHSHVIFGSAIANGANTYVSSAASGATSSYAIASFLGSGDRLDWAFRFVAPNNSAYISNLLYFAVSQGNSSNCFMQFNSGGIMTRITFFGRPGNFIDMQATNFSVILGQTSTSDLYRPWLANNAMWMFNTNSFFPRATIEAAGQIKTRDAFFTSYSGIGRLTSGVCVVTLPYGMTTTNYHPFVQYIGNSGLVAVVPEVSALTTNAFTVTASSLNATNFHWMIMGEIAR